MQKDDFIEKLVHVNRITKVVKGGRRFGFSALVVVGNQNGKIGIAHAKAKQVPDAIKKANELARRNLLQIPLRKEELFTMMYLVKMVQEKLKCVQPLREQELLQVDLLERFVKY